MGLLNQALHVVDESDLILLMIDARFPSFSRNALIEKVIENKKKQGVFVINKIDLVDQEKLDEIKKIFAGKKLVFISSKKRMGSKFLRLLISIEAKKANKERFIIGVTGYPNTGKSSLINLLSGRGSARVSNQAGFTRGRQLIRLKDGIYLLDSPGVIPFNENDSFKLVLFNALSINQLKDTEQSALELLEFTKKEKPDFLVEQGLSLKEINSCSGDELLDLIALKKNLKLKGNKPNTKLASIKIIQEWQKN